MRVLHFIMGILGTVLSGFDTNLENTLPVFGFSWASLFVPALGALVFVAIVNDVRR